VVVVVVPEVVVVVVLEDEVWPPVDFVVVLPPEPVLPLLVLLHAAVPVATPTSANIEKITARKRFEYIGKLLFESPRGATTMEQLDRSQRRCPSGSSSAGGTKRAGRRPLALSIVSQKTADESGSPHRTSEHPLLQRTCQARDDTLRRTRVVTSISTKHPVFMISVGLFAALSPRITDLRSVTDANEMVEGDDLPARPGLCLDITSFTSRVGTTSPKQMSPALEAARPLA
jgi:hypothetical protein